MKHVVTVTFDGHQTKCDPASLRIDAGDTVQWISPDADLALDFGHANPFTTAQVWKARRGQLTPVADVKPQLTEGHVFRPTISINGKAVAKSLGDLIVRLGSP